MAGRSFATTTTPTANDVKNKLAGLASGLLSNPESKLPTLQKLVDAAKATAQKTTQTTTQRSSTPVSATAPVTPTISWAVPSYDSGGGSGGSSSGSPGYDAATQAYKEAMDAAYNQTKAQYMAQAEQLKGQYDTTRGQAYTNSRLNAIGNNEALASMGLAGNMYDAPQSGYSETSRIAENTAMRGSINEANLGERQARDTIASEIVKAGYTRDQSVAQYTADILVQKAQDQLQRDLAAQQLELQYAQLNAELAAAAAKNAPKTSSSSRSSSSKKVTVPTPVSVGQSQGSTMKSVLAQRKG